MIFQDPLASLNPRMTIGDIIAEPLITFYPTLSREQVKEKVRAMMTKVGLLPNLVNRYPMSSPAASASASASPGR